MYGITPVAPRLYTFFKRNSSGTVGGIAAHAIDHYGVGPVIYGWPPLAGSLEGGFLPARRRLRLGVSAHNTCEQQCGKNRFVRFHFVLFYCYKSNLIYRLLSSEIAAI